MFLPIRTIPGLFYLVVGIGLNFLLSKHVDARPEITPKSAPNSEQLGLEHSTRSMDLTDSAVRQTKEERKRKAEATAAFVLGKQAEDLGDFQSALKYYQQASKFDDEFVQIPLRQALVLLQQSKLDEAVALLKQHIEKQPDSPAVHSLLAHSYSIKKDEDKAMSHARIALEKDPTLISNYKILFNGFHNQGRNDRINDLLSKAKRTNSEDAKFYIRLGQLWLKLLTEANFNVPRTEHYIKILPLYEKAYEADKSNPFTIAQVGEIAFRAGEYDKAIHLFHKTLKLSDSNHHNYIREHLAIALLTVERDAESIDVLEALLKDEPQRTMLYPVLAELYRKTEQLEKAEDYFRLATMLNSKSDPEVYMQLVRIQLERDRNEAAIETVQKAQEIFPKVVNFKWIYAKILAHQKKYKEAENIFSETETLALQLRTEVLDADFYMEFAAICEKNKNIPRAKLLLEKLLKKEPENHQALNFLGYMLAEQKLELANAKNYILQALSYEPDNAAYLDSLGWVYYQMGHYEEAVTYLEKAVQNDEPNVDPVIFEH
ncbi:MAG: tetratricopeptide repeat protein, partial [Verrucomicrobiota bacterium]